MSAFTLKWYQSMSIIIDDYYLMLNTIITTLHLSAFPLLLTISQFFWCLYFYQVFLPHRKGTPANSSQLRSTRVDIDISAHSKGCAIASGQQTFSRRVHRLKAYRGLQHPLVCVSASRAGNYLTEMTNLLYSLEWPARCQRTPSQFTFIVP